MSAQGVLNFFCEVGPANHAVSFLKALCLLLGLCRITASAGAKILSSKPATCAAARQCLAHGRNHFISQPLGLGDYFRRLRARLGSPAAITAAAHKPLASSLPCSVTALFDPQLLGALNEKTIFAAVKLPAQILRSSRL